MPYYDHRQPATPNGLRDRMPLIGLGVGIIVLIVVVLWLPERGGGSAPPTTAPASKVTNTGWVNAYIYDGATGQGVSIGPDGTVLASFSEMGEFGNSRVVTRSRSIAFLPNADAGSSDDESEGNIDIGPLAADSTGPGEFSVPVPGGAEVAVLGVPDKLVFGVHQPDGGNILIVDADARQTLDLGKLLDNPEPKYTLDELQLEPTGEQYAIYEKDTDRTAVLSFSRPRPRFFEHRALAVSTDRIVTTRNEGRKSITTVFRSDGTEVTSFESDPLASATMDGHTVYLITKNNEVLRLTDGAAEPTTLARVPDSKKVALAQLGKRVIVDSPWGFTFLDESGAELGQLRPGAGGVQNPSRNSLCLATDVNDLVTRDDTSGSGGRGPSVLDLGNLKLTPIANLPIHSATPDGCTVATEIDETNTYQLVSAVGGLSLAETGENPVVGPYDRLFLSPNPNQWIAMMPDKTVKLFELVDGTPTELATIPFPNVDYITVSFTAKPAVEQ